MADCLISSVKEIGKCILWPAIKPHFDYWWCFDSNIQGLKDVIDQLKQKKYSTEQGIAGAMRRLEVVRPEVEEWFNASTDKLEEARKILLPDDNLPKAWKLISRYSLGKNAKETAEEIAKHLKKGEFDLIADPALPPSMASQPDRSTMDFESRKGIEEDIIKFLKEGSVDVIGIFGMGGVGKTTMADRIAKKVEVENLFEEVIKVTVSQKINEFKIQDEIAEWLGLKLHGRQLAARATKLRTRLKDAKRKIIILDDVWKSLRFEELGIPIESNCKVLLTSRIRDSCNTIKNRKVFELNTLEREEAWILFKDNVGKCVEQVGCLAIDVAAECKGLPIALVTVGQTLQNETNMRTWKNSLLQLRKSNPTDLPEVIEKVYQPLKLSYGKLHTDVEKNFFLLCCLFPEDYNIPVEQLTWYSMGLQMFDDISSIEQATNKVHTLVGRLKSRFLLIDGGDKLHVKMHDVVRDVAIYIGSKEKNGFLKSLTSIKNSSDDNCNWMSVDISNEQMEVPLVSLFPKLQLLMLLKSSSNELSHISFEGMKDLNVLSFQSSWVGSLPPSLGSLKNLQTLCLVNCEVENISVIGELTSLEIFSCYGCKNITELPAKIGSDLRLLELSKCKLLQTIPFGVISSLSRLEELKMRGSFSGWEAEENGKERRNASLKELEGLPNLTCLEIEIDDCTLSAQEIIFSRELVKYYIRIGDVSSYIEERDYEKVMILNLPSDIVTVEKWIQKLVRNTEGLYLQGDGSVSNNFNIAEIKDLKNLRVEKCPTLKKLVETKGIVFGRLEILRLEGLENLQEICDLNQNVFLVNLKSIKIRTCPKLRSLFSTSAARRCLSQLEVLEIEKCDKLEVVFWNEIRDDSTDGSIEFPELKELTLHNLPNLTAFWEGLEKKDVLICNLKSINISHCNNLRYLFSMSFTT